MPSPSPLSNRSLALAMTVYEVFARGKHVDALRRSGLEGTTPLREANPSEDRRIVAKDRSYSLYGKGNSKKLTHLSQREPGT
jgi:hypothetical protein